MGKDHDFEKTVLIGEIAKWKTPNTYDHNEYGDPENKSGVYAIFFWNKRTWKKRLVYIGSAVNLGRRHRGHNIMRPNKMYARFHFFKCENYIELEKKLIKRLRPLLNKAHKNV